MFKIKAEQKLGEMIDANPDIHPGQKEMYHHDTFLSDFDISRLQSSRWQKEAQIPDDLLLRYIAEMDDAEKEASTLGAMRYWLTSITRSLSDNVPLPEGIFNVFFADPPWRYDFSETTRREIENQYQTMELKDIKRLVIPAKIDAVLFLWATAPKLLEALEVMIAWGFQYKTQAVWDKEKIGMGYWFRGQHELLLIGTKGNFPAPEAEARVSSVIREKRTEHSVKPSCIYDLIEQMCPGLSYIELFARKKHSDKWQVWGNEAGSRWKATGKLVRSYNRAAC